MTDQHLDELPLDESTDLSPADSPGHRNADEGISYLTLSLGQDQQDWLGGWKLTDQLERRTQRILNDQEGLDLS